MIVIEPADKHGGVGSHRVRHGNTSILKGMIHIFHHQALLWVERQKLVFGDVEEGTVKIGGVLGKEMTSLYVKLNNVQHSDPTTTVTMNQQHPPCLHVRDLDDKTPPH